MAETEDRDPAPIAAGLLPGWKTPVDPAAWTAAGFTLGPEQDDPGTDRTFHPATLPAGWTHVYAADWHGGYIVDGRGVNRVEVLVTTRWAGMTLLDVADHYGIQAVYGRGDPAAAVPWDRLTADERAGVLAYAREVIGRIKPSRGRVKSVLRAEAVIASAAEVEDRAGRKGGSGV